MSGFVDIHTHLAWDIDDGFLDKEATMNALASMQKDGITTAITTPHVVPGQINEELFEVMKQRMKEVRELAADYNITIFEGCELFLNASYLEVLDSMQYFSLANSEYILVEFDVRKNMIENNDAEDILYEITIRDKVPIIAHVERYFHDDIDIERVQQWVDMGCFIQINRTSLLGMHGATIKKNAEKLLQNGLAHVVASDAHRDKGNRICKLSDAYELLHKKMGQEIADILCKRNPEHILQNEELESIEVKKTSVFKRLWRK